MKLFLKSCENKSVVVMAAPVSNVRFMCRQCPQTRAFGKLTHYSIYS